MTSPLTRARKIAAAASSATLMKISIKSGGGYAGSVYAANVPGGQWYADGVAIIGASSQTWTMTVAYEGAIITYRMGGRISNEIELWVASDLGASLSSHFDARVLSSLTISAPYVSSWASLTGSSAISSTGANRPTYDATGLNGKPTVVYDGVSSFLRTPSETQSAAWTVQAVGKKTTASTLRLMVAVDDEVIGRQAQLLRIGPKVGTLAFNAAGSVFFTETTTSVVSGVPFVATGVHQTSPGRILTAYLNDGGSSFVIPTGTPRSLSTYFSVGSGTFNAAPTTPFDGSISEVIYLNRDVTIGERQKLAAYSAWRFGLESSLDVSNPYRAAPPFLIGP